MPIGLVSEAEFMKEISGLDKGSDKGSDKITRTSTEPDQSVESHTPEVSVVSEPQRGRSGGDVNVPDSLRKIIGEEALLNGRTAALGLAKDFGISASSVSAYSKGATSTTSYNTPSSSIIQHINKARHRAVKRASSTLNSALGAITQEKLDYSDAKDLSGIAKDMSVIIRNLEPASVSEADQSAKTPQFVIYAPQFRQENSFESITVTE